MKIIQIMDTLTSTGGVNIFVFELCIALHKAGQDISLIGILGNKDTCGNLAMPVRNAGIPVYCLCMESKQDAILHGMPKLKKQIKQIANGKKTVCNLHLKLSVLLGGLATRGMKNIKCVETYHSRYSKYWLERKVMSPCISKYICCSDSASEEFISRFHPNRNKVVSIPNGIDVDRLRSKEMHNKISNDNRVIFLSVGRFTKQKNLHVTIEAFATISNQTLLYKLIGNGPLFAQEKNVVKEDSAVQFLGMVPHREVIDELSRSDMVVLPSLWEGLSIFMLEAMAMRCPLMISNVESLRAVVNEKELNQGEEWRQCAWGYLVDTSNVQAYAQAAQHYVSHPELKMKMSVVVGKMVEQYSIFKTAEQYINVYNSLIGV